jgi:hypothetical protein
MAWGRNGERITAIQSAMNARSDKRYALERFLASEHPWQVFEVTSATVELRVMKAEDVAILEREERSEMRRLAIRRMELEVAALERRAPKKRRK